MESKINSEAFDEMDFTRLLKIILKRKWIIFALTLITLVISVILNYIVLSPVYETKVVLMVTNPTEQQYYPAREEQTLEGLARTLATLPQMTLKTYEGQLKNERLLESLVKDLKLDEEKYTIKHLNKNISTNVVKDTNLLEIKVNDNDPVLAALIANTLSNNFLDYISEKSKERMQQSRQIFKGQIVSIEKELVQAKKMLSDFNSQTRNISYLEEELRVKQESLNINQQALIQSGNETAYIPIINQLEIDIEQLQSEIVGKQWEYRRLIQEVERLERNYNLFADQISETQIFESVDMGKSSIMIVATAMEPTIPVSPKKEMNVSISFGVTLLLGVSLAFILELFDTMISDTEDVIHYLGLTVIGKIPFVDFKAKDRDQKQKGQYLITYSDPKSPEAEAFRTIRTNLYYYNLDHRFKKVMLTSTGPAEGKSTIIANLAIVLAQTGKKVLLVDADLRRPTLHSIFDAGNLVGLSSCLEKKLSLMEVVQKTKIENLYIITSGFFPLKPSELNSSKIDELFEDVEAYDYILFDTPPAGTFTDALVLSEKVDAVLVVINSKKVPIDLAQQTIEKLRNAKTEIIGVIFNNVQYEKDFYKNYYYYGDKK